MQSRHKGYYHYAVMYDKKSKTQPNILPIDGWLSDKNSAIKWAKNYANDNGYPVRGYWADLDRGVLTKSFEVKPNKFSKDNPMPRQGRQSKEPTSPAYTAAKEMAEKFHGRGSKGVTEVKRVIKYNLNLAELGSLEGFVIKTGGGKGSEIMFPEGAVTLACTPDGKQLIIQGLEEGATKLELGDIWWLPESEKNKQMVCIGEVYMIYYFADKHHLQGPKSQKNGESYKHRFGEKDGVAPWLIYDAMNESLSLVGGSYTVEDVGIYN